MSLKDEKTVYVVVTGEYSEPEDEEVQGIYEIAVAGHLSEGQKREAALDQFHDHIGIEMLEDFRIVVVDDQGRSLVGLEKYENGELTSFADYRGGVAPNDVPAPVAAIFDEHAA